MKLAFVIAPHAKHQLDAAMKLTHGMRQFGDYAEIVSTEVFHRRLKDFDAACTWGWAKGLQLRQLGINVLVMERAYVDDRFLWTSLGWNGLNGRATWPSIQDYGVRWQMHFDKLMKEWTQRKGYALLMGQVPSDTAVRHINFLSWASSKAAALRRAGYDVVFRGHPKAPRMFVPGCSPSLNEDIKKDLELASIAVTYNSNSGVDAVLAGVPTFAEDKGSMVWSVSNHDENDMRFIPTRPAREVWAAELAWKQFLPKELESGLAWSVVREVVKK